MMHRIVFTLWPMIIFAKKSTRAVKEKKQRWTVADVPSQKGRYAVVTGANSGLGFHIAQTLSARGAKVIMACRNLDKGMVARRRIEESGPPVSPEVRELDLGDLSSVKGFADGISRSYPVVDLLINNAGLMAIPYHRTADGFEMQFGVNHLGHFALTARLLPLIREAGEGRVVNVSSAAHRLGRIRYEDIHWERRYRKWRAYGMSKLANLLFTLELDRRFRTGEGNMIAVAAHPGYAATELQSKGAVMAGSGWRAGAFQLANRLAAQPALMGALPVLYAATAEGVEGGAYFGPGGWLRMWGYPAPDRPAGRLVTAGEAKKLWELSESLTGIKVA